MIKPAQAGFFVSGLRQCDALPYVNTSWSICVASNVR